MPRPRPVIDDTHLLVSGNVVIHPTATIAPDVLLQADPDCQLVVAAGACIGTGSVLHAYQGKLTIESGATLGSGVLVVGHGTIGAEACIGAMSTIINRSIEANQSVPPGSLIGDHSRQADLPIDPATVSTFVPPSPPAPPSTFQTFSPSPPAPQPTHQTFIAPETNGATPPAPPNPPSAPPTAITPSEPPSKKAMTQVYGQAYLERIMITMFPYRQQLELPAEPPENPPDSPAG
jgi:carbon dioxide concentrating mechanism protein CcmN